MATYAELSTITEDPLWNDLLAKIRVACVVKAGVIIDSPTPSATALEWAKAAVLSPTKAAEGVAFYVVIANKDATIAQIYAAGDAAVQTNVDSAIDALYGA